MNIIQRVNAPTPKFFVKLRNISLALGAVGAALIGAPAALPAIILKIAGYAIVAGTVGTIVSQTVVPGEEEPKNRANNGTFK